MNLSRQFTRREKILLLVLAILLVAAVYYLVIQQGVAEAIDEAESRIETLETESSILQVKYAKLCSMEDELEEIHKDPDPVIVPAYDNLQQVMMYLNTVLSTANSYSINFQTVTEPEEGGYIAQRAVSMNFTCPNYAAASSMISALQKSPYCCKLADMSIAPITEAGTTGTGSVESGSVSVNLTMTFFESVK